MVTVTNTSIQCGSQRGTRGGGAHRRSKADTHVNRYGRHIGRVGALAVALGIGVAVASTPGVAWADDTGSASSGDTTGTAGATGTSGTSESEGTSTTPGTTTGATGPSAVKGSPTDGAAAAGPGAVDASQSSTSASTDASVRQVPPGMVLATGGADSSSKSSSETPATGDVAAKSTTDDTAAPEPAADSTATEPEVPAAVTAPVGGPRGGSKKRQQLVEHPTGGPGVDANTLTATGNAVLSRPGISQPPRTVLAAVPQAVTALTGTSPLLPQTISVAAQPISAAPEEHTPPRSEVSEMALGLLGGLDPLTTNGSPVDSPLGLALMAVGARPRQFGQAVAEESRSLPVSPTLTSLAIDTIATKESQQTVVGDDSTFGLAAMSTSQTVSEVTSAAPVTTGSSPAGVVVSPDGKRVYVANTGSKTVSVIDNEPASVNYNTVISTVSVGSSPSALAISPDGTRLYVANTGNRTVSVINIDTATNTYQRIDANPSIFSMDIRVGSSPSALALSGTRLYVANRGSNTVSVIDTATNKVIDANPSIFSTGIKVGSSPSALALSGTRLYVANRGSGTVSVINTATNSVTNTITVGSQPSSVAVSPDGTRAYVANTGSGTVSVININAATNTYTLVDTNPSVAGTQSIFVGSSPSSVAVSPDPGGSRLYVALSSDMVAVINTSSNVVSLAQIDAAPESGAHSLALGPDGRVYVTDGADRALRSMSLVDGTVTIGRSDLVLPGSNGYVVQATWYFPNHDDPPVGLIYLQHGLSRTDTNVSALAQQLADRTNSIVVTPAVSSNRFDRYYIWNDPIERAVAALFVGDRSALTASATAAAGHPVTLPQQVVLAGHSAGGNLVAAVAGYLADAGAAGNLKGVILFDSADDGDATTGMAKLTDAAVPVMLIAARGGAMTNRTINAAPAKFVAVMLDGGNHFDAEGASIDSQGMFGPAPKPQNAAAVQTITAAWINDVFTGSDTGIYAPAGTLISVNGATARVLAVRGLNQSATVA